MRFIAIEKSLCPLMLGEEVLQEQQAKQIYDLYLKNYILEMNCIEDSQEIVLKMEAISKREALAILSKLPLVRAGKSTFELIEIQPYSGFERWLK